MSTATLPPPPTVTAATTPTPRVQLILTPDTRALLIKLLSTCSRKQDTPLLHHVRFTRDLAATRVTVYAGNLDRTVTLVLPHLTTAEPLAVQQQRHAVYSGTFVVSEALTLLHHLRQADKALHPITLEPDRLHPLDAITFTYQLHGRPFPVSLGRACDRVKKGNQETLIDPGTVLHTDPATLSTLPRYLFHPGWLAPILDRLVTHYASTDETRYMLNGVFLDPQPGDLLNLVATNGKVLQRGTWKIAPLLPSEGDAFCPVIAPSCFLQSLLSLTGVAAPSARSAPLFTAVTLAQDSSNPKRVPLHASLTARTGASLTVTSVAIDANYPNYAAVIPASGHYTLRLTDPAQAIRYVKTIGCPPSAAKLNATHLVLDGAHGHLCGSNGTLYPIGTLSPAKDAPPIDPSKPLRLGVNPDFLATAFACSTHLHFTDEISPLVATGPGLTTVIMPTRLTGD